MGFSSLTANQRIIVALMLRNEAAYVAGMRAASGATRRLGVVTTSTGLAMQSAQRRTFLMNQAMFTMRRYAFYATTAITVLAGAVVKLGFDYNSAMQQARVALSPLIPNTSALNEQLNALFEISRLSPFVLSDMTKAFSALYLAMSPLGISGKTITTTLQSVANYLSVVQQTTPLAMRRITNALTDLAYQGTLSGRMFQRLGQIGIPMAAILSKELGITGNQLRNITSLGISAQDVLKAINDYAAHTAGITGAAARLSLQTVTGQFAVLKDTVGQLLGTMIGGQQGTGGIWARWTNFMGGLVGPGGAFSKLTKAAGQGGTTAVILKLSELLTGSNGLGRGLLLLAEVLGNIGRVFIYILIPAFVMAAKTLVVFAPLLWGVNQALKFLIDNANAVKWVLAPLATIFMITHFAALAWWGSTKILSLALFGESVIVMRLFRAARLYFVLVSIFGWKSTTRMAAAFLWNISVGKQLAVVYNLLLVSMKRLIAAIIWETVLLRENIVAFGLLRGIILYTRTALVVGLIPAVYGFTAALLTNPVVQFTLVIVALYLAMKNLKEIYLWFKRNSLIYNTIAPKTDPKTGKKHRATDVFLSGIGAMAGGFRAMGGPVMAGAGYVVGEHGPELFTPSVSGRIVPNHELKASNTLSTVTAQRNDDGRPTVIQLVVDRKVLAESVVRAKQDAEARR